MFNYHYRRCPRLKGYDYSQPGYYFITICVKHMVCCFGEIKVGQMILNEYGRIVENYWRNLPKYYKNCALDEFIIMPNHIHGVVNIVAADLKSARTPTLSMMVQGFKIFSTRKIHEGADFKSARTDSQLMNKFHWQRSFYDSIVRDDDSLYRIRQYIRDNPKNWQIDKCNLSR